MSTIYLIQDEARPGAWNMAADEWLMDEAARQQVPMLRTYGWLSPTLSLGYFQAEAARKLHRPSLNCEWVRRASGGGAIMHHHEVTYALAVPAKSARGFAQPLYDLVHEALVDELETREINAHLHPIDPTMILPQNQQPFMCFARRAGGDVMLDDQKILGSAQRRSAHAVVQHGSLLLRRSPHAPELLGVQDLVSQTIVADDLVTRWLARIAASMGGHFELRSLADSECDRINYAACEKFGADRWALRR